MLVAVDGAPAEPTSTESPSFYVWSGEQRDAAIVLGQEVLSFVLFVAFSSNPQDREQKLQRCKQFVLYPECS